MDPNVSRVVAIVVAYFPEPRLFGELLDTLLAQLSSVVVVDNTPGDENPQLQSVLAERSDRVRCRLVRLGENTGIAHAINVGVQSAIDDGANFVLLSDQDSLPANDMVKNLWRAYSDLVAQGMTVGAVGPTFTDLHTAITYPFQAKLPGRYFYGHKSPDEFHPHIDALTLITSGSLIPIDVMWKVGAMREDFFIDHVDIEWCHRARSLGYSLFGTGWARMYQRMGETRLRVWYLRWRYESEYSPLRIYYRIRNFVVIWKIDYIELRWKIRSTWYWLGIVFVHIVFSRKNNLTYLLYAIRGGWHGLINRMGQYRG